MLDLWWTKLHWGRFSPSTSASPDKLSTDCSRLFIRGRYNRSVVASVTVSSGPVHPKRGGLSSLSLPIVLSSRSFVISLCCLFLFLLSPSYSISSVSSLFLTLYFLSHFPLSFLFFLTLPFSFLLSFVRFLSIPFS
jgi:hypothetical protein